MKVTQHWLPGSGGHTSCCRHRSPEPASTLGVSSHGTSPRPLEAPPSPPPVTADAAQTPPDSGPGGAGEPWGCGGALAAAPGGLSRRAGFPSRTRCRADTSALKAPHLQELEREQDGRREIGRQRLGQEEGEDGPTETASTTHTQLRPC